MRRRTLLAVTLGLTVALPLASATALAADNLRPYAAYSLPAPADAIAVGDVTGDGRADVVVTTGYSGNAAVDFHIFVLAQTPAGTLASPVSYATAGSYTARPESVAVGDITGDGRPDVVVGLDRYGIQVFPALPDGTLGAPTFTATTDSTRIRLGHLDGDTTLDVAGIGWASNTVSVFRNVGNAGLGTPDVYPAQHGGYDDLELGDVTGDGLADIVVMSGQLYAIPSISVLAQQAGGGFGPAATYSVGTNILTHGIGLGDVNGDGRNDIVASYGGNRPSSFIAVFLQNAGGTLDAPVSYPSYDIPEPVDVADINDDGRADVVTLHGGWQQAGVYLQSNGALAAEQLYPIPYASHYNPHGLAIGDVTGDGWPDVVEADSNNGVIVLANAGPQATVPGAPTLTSVTAGNGSIAAAWSAPASDGGSAITSYTATASPGGASCSSAQPGCTIAGLTNGTLYSVTVTATNAIGTGPASNALSATPITVPGAPTKVAAGSGPKGITVSWAKPASTGGSAITGYRVYRSTASGGETFLVGVGSGTFSWLDKSVARRTRYYYWVTALNAAGESVASAEVSAVSK